MRLELGPSRLLAQALRALGIAGAGGLLLTDLPLAAAIVGGIGATAWAFWRARDEQRRPRRSLVLRSNGVVELCASPVDDFQLRWQGVFATLEWRLDGRRERFVAWPDVLDATARRELRLWAVGRGVRASTAAVAP